MNRAKNQCPLPALLSALIAEHRWRQPSDAVISSVIPFLCDPVDFLLTEDRIRAESSGSLADVPEMASLFHLYRGSMSEARPLPWLDVDQSLFVAVNRHPGDDEAVALDFRMSSVDPRVVASDWADDYRCCKWREVSSTLSTFVNTLGL